MGFEEAGFDIVAAVDLDPIHAATHHYNCPHTVTICRALQDLHGNQVRRIAGIGDRTIDVVVGGPPCQGFSLIGKRVLEDPRNALVFHFVRLVRELSPRYFLMENVPGMVTGDHTQLFEELLVAFQGAGYRPSRQILNAAHYGVPQDRSRLFIVGVRDQLPLPSVPERETRLRGERGSGRGGNYELFPTLPECPSVAEALADLPDIDEWDDLFERDELFVALPPAGSAYAAILRGEVSDESDYSYPRAYPEKVLTGCRRARHTRVSRRRFENTPQGAIEPVSRFYKLPWDGVANTLRSGTASDRGAFTSPRPIHPLYARCISVREAARLHSFPDWFRFHWTKWHGFRQIGNSVPPYLARAVARSIMKALGVRPTKPSRVVALGDPSVVRYTMSEAARYFSVSPDVIPSRQRQKARGRKG